MNRVLRAATVVLVLLSTAVDRCRCEEGSAAADQARNLFDRLILTDSGQDYNSYGLKFSAADFLFMPTFNATLLQSVAVVAHFAIILGAAYLVSVLPQRVFRGYNTFLSQATRRIGEAPPPHFVDPEHLDYEDYLDSSDSWAESGRQKKKKRRKQRDLAEEDGDSRRQRASPLEWLSRLYESLTQPFTNVTRSYSDLMEFFRDFWKKQKYQRRQQHRPTSSISDAGHHDNNPAEHQGNDNQQIGWHPSQQDGHL